MRSGFVENDPALVSYKAFLEEFGNDEVIVTALRSNRPAIDAERLGRLKRITDRLQADPDVGRVLSLATLTLPQNGAVDHAMRPALSHPVTETHVNVLDTAIKNGRIASSLVGDDEHTLIIYTWLKSSADIDQQRNVILGRITSIFDESIKGSDEQVYHAGMGVMYDALNQATFGEGAMFIGLSYLVITLALFMITGRVLWTLLALVVITLTDVTLFGIMGLLNLADEHDHDGNSSTGYDSGGCQCHSHGNSNGDEPGASSK